MSWFNDHKKLSLWTNVINYETLFQKKFVKRKTIILISFLWSFWINYIYCLLFPLSSSMRSFLRRRMGYELDWINEFYFSITFFRILLAILAKARVSWTKKKNKKWSTKETQKQCMLFWVYLYNTFLFHNLNQLVTLSRAWSAWQPLKPIRHNVLCLHINGGTCLEAISIAKILR